MKKFAFLVILAAAACAKKQKLVHPVACMTADKTTAKIGDTITFTDCSEHAVTFTGIYFPHEQKDPNVTSYASFDENRQYKKVFSKAGKFVGIVQAVGANGTRIQTDSVVVTIAE